MEEQQFQCIASSAFGLEGLVAAELRGMGMQGVKPRQFGGVDFCASLPRIFDANLHLHTADRVLLVMGTGADITTYEALFDFAYSLPWEQMLPRDCAFPIRAQCARSQLMDPSSCQSLVKKAIANRLMDRHRAARLPETGPRYQVDVLLNRNQVVLALDSSGDALSRRGYRTWNGEAPLRETLAAALITLSGWQVHMPLYDPCCGTGTLLIEAAHRALDRAPGLERSFAMEGWPIVDAKATGALRAQAREAYHSRPRTGLSIAGSDIDPDAIELAKRHARQAGVADVISLTTADLRTVRRQGPPGFFLTNPPYGERLGDKKAAQAVTRALRDMVRAHPGWQLCAFSADAGFERTYGQRAHKKRRLYNGRLECEFMQFDGGKRHD